MQADLPHTLYAHDKKKKDRGRKNLDDFTFNPNDPAIAKQMEANRKRQERLEKEKEEGQYTMDELFNKR